MFTDIYDKTTETLYEAKGSVARASIRMAIGQLADYARLVDPTPKKAILVPERPRADLMDLLRAEGIAVFFPEGSTFERAEQPA